jgi:hypothetical protein
MLWYNIEKETCNEKIYLYNVVVIMFIFFVVWSILCIVIYILTNAILVSYQKYKKVQKRLAMRKHIIIL